jgi:hypothetical protein
VLNLKAENISQGQETQRKLTLLFAGSSALARSAQGGDANGARAKVGSLNLLPNLPPSLPKT